MFIFSIILFRVVCSVTSLLMTYDHNITNRIIVYFNVPNYIGSVYYNKIISKFVMKCVMN